MGDCPENIKENGFRLFGAYYTNRSVKLYVIT